MKKRMISNFILICFILLTFCTSAFANTKTIMNFSINVDNEEVEIGQEITATIMGKNVEDMYAFEIVVVFDPDKLQFIEAKTKNQGYSTNAIIEGNKIYYVFTRIGDNPPLEGNFELCSFEFITIKPNTTSLQLESVRVINSELKESMYSVNNMTSLYIYEKKPSSDEEIPPTPTPTPTPAPTPITEVDTDEDIELPKEEIPGAIIFTDIEHHWSKEFALKLVDMRILKGYLDNTLKPDQEITRAEGVVMLVNTLGLDIADNNEDIKFDDSDGIPEWSKNHVKAAVDKGILTGYEDNTFRPFNELTRAEMVVLVMKTFGYEKSELQKTSFDDNNDIPEWAFGYIAKAIEEGIVAGYPDNTFKASNKVTRGEVFALIVKCIEKI